MSAIERSVLKIMTGSFLLALDVFWMLMLKKQVIHLDCEVRLHSY